MRAGGKVHGPSPSGQEGWNLSLVGPGQQERRGTAAQRDQGGVINGPDTSSQLSEQWPKKLKPSRQTWKWMPGLSPTLAGLVRETVEGRQLGRSLPTWVGKERVGRGWDLGAML